MDNLQTHALGCMANIKCLVLHTDGVCTGPYGKCTCPSINKNNMPKIESISTLLSEEKGYITKEQARRNIAEWLYVNDGAYTNKEDWRSSLIRVIAWNIKHIQ